MTRTTVHADAAPAPVGPYSHAASSGEQGLLHLSGQTPIDPATGRLVDGDVSTQARQVFTNLQAVLAAAGRTLDDVVKVNVYLVDMADFSAVNEVYATVFAEPYPARTTVAVAGLPLGARVEIELVAGHPSVR
jgi:2-iminobutanoate/2-iminopropanoate deaminase